MLSMIVLTGLFPVNFNKIRPITWTVAELFLWPLTKFYEEAKWSIFIIFYIYHP